MNNLYATTGGNMEHLYIEKMSNIDISQDSVMSITDKCNDYNKLKKTIED